MTTPALSAARSRRIRFVATAANAPEPEPDVQVVVLDSAWTPAAGDRPDVRPLRPLVLEVLREHDPLEASRVLIDRWAAEAGIARRMEAHGASWWYRQRLVAWRGLHERLVWIWVLARLSDEGHIAAVELPAASGALYDAAALVGASCRWMVKAPPPVPVSAQAAAPPVPTVPWPIGPVLWRLGRHPAQRGPEADRRRMIATRVDAMRRRQALLAADPGRLLVLTAPASHQTLGGPGASRVGDPFLGPIVDALRGTRLEPIVVELGSDVADSAAWARLTAPAAGRRLPAEPLLRGMANEADEPAVEAARQRVADELEGPMPALVTDGADLSPWVVGELRRYAASGLAGHLRAVRRICRLLTSLRPSGLLMVNEYSLPEWIVAAHDAGVPVVAVQHGIIHKHHAGYVLPSRDGLPLPDRTYVFGVYEARLLTEGSVYRPDEVRVGGAPRLDLAAPPDEDESARDRQDMRAALHAGQGERLVVFSSTSSASMRETTFAVALDTLLDAPWPRVRLVVKLHPAEAASGFYESLVEGIARARGFAPPPVTTVKDIDLFALLRASDAHLGVSSTVLTDAVVAGTRNLLAAGLHGTDLLGYVEAGVARPVQCAADLLAELDRDEDRGAAEQARARFLADHFAPGPSAARIAADLLAGVSTPSAGGADPAVTRSAGGSSAADLPSTAPSAAPAAEPLTLRPATADDAELLLAWANDPTTRATAFHPERITEAEHRRWLAARLASPDTRLLIGGAGGQSIGMLRLDRDATGDVEVSISVAASERGRGTGRLLLADGLQAGADFVGPGGSFVARIRPDNAASLALFRGAGFGGDRSTAVNGHPCLVLARRVHERLPPRAEHPRQDRHPE